MKHLSRLFISTMLSAALLAGAANAQIGAVRHEVERASPGAEVPTKSSGGMSKALSPQEKMKKDLDKMKMQAASEDLKKSGATSGFDASGQKPKGPDASEAIEYQKSMNEMRAECRKNCEAAYAQKSKDEKSSWAPKMPTYCAAHPLDAQCQEAAQKKQSEAAAKKAEYVEPCTKQCITDKTTKQPDIH